MFHFFFSVLLYIYLLFSYYVFWAFILKFSLIKTSEEGIKTLFHFTDMISVISEGNISRNLQKIHKQYENSFEYFIASLIWYK